MAIVPDGSVPLASVIQVLQVLSQAGGFTVSVSDCTLTLVKDSSPEVVTLSDPVGRRMVARLAHKYLDGKAEYFYHPDMVVGGNGAKH